VGRKTTQERRLDNQASATNREDLMRDKLEELAARFLDLPSHAREQFIAELDARGGAAEWVPIFRRFHDDLTKKDK
jgi:hypothetical protein